MSKEPRSKPDPDEDSGNLAKPQSACGPSNYVLKSCGPDLCGPRDLGPWWKRLPFTYSTVPPLPNWFLDDSPLTPEANAGFVNLLLLNWITPLLQLGYVRPLEAVDLWKLAPDHSAADVGRIISESFERRAKKVEEYNERLLNGEESVGIKGIWWSIRGIRQEKEAEWRTTTGKKRASLTWAINDSVVWWFWSGGFLKVVGDTAQVTSPLVMKALITFVAESYYNHKYGGTVPSLGKGVGLAFVLLAVQIIGSLCTQQYNYRALTTGVLVRGGLITAIYERSLKLSSRARSTLPNGKLVNHISTDVSRIDFCAGFFHAAWTAVIQLVICLALLIHTIGVSALAGFATFFAVIPVSMILIKWAFATRQVTMQWTDKRVKLLQEVLGGMKIVKYFAWEPAILKRISDLRSQEIWGIRTLLLLKAGNISLVLVLPTIATIVGLVTYSLTGHSLDPAAIFTALSFFNLLRFPLLFLPISIHTIVDAKNAVNRLQLVFEADLLDSTHETNEELEYAVEIKGASFTWDAPPPNEIERSEKEDKDRTKGFPNSAPRAPRPSGAGDKVDSSEGKQEKTNTEAFQVVDVTLTIPRGKLVAIVGSVGSGKSSLLQGMIGEMRKTSGSVVFGGSVAYCPQVAWVQNATIRENVCFGRPFDEQRYWQAIHDASLGPDLEMLPHGDLTEVGEKGVSLSGGQKQRVNICRAIYCDMNIEIFDDPLSALDAHVGKAVFNDVFKKNLSEKTRILVTHALHFLPQVDYIYVVDNGRIVEEGTYREIMNRRDGFSRFITTFGSAESQGLEGQKPDVVDLKDDPAELKAKDAANGDAIMQDEERNTGAVAWGVYKVYFWSGRGGLLLVPLLLGLIGSNAASAFSSYWLVWWQEDKWHQSPGFYMGVLGGFGVIGVVTTFLAGAVFAIFAYFSSQRLHRILATRVLHAPMSFFDTTPLGRIMNRFSKDIDTVDNVLIDAYRIFINIIGMIISAIVLISVLIPWFLIAIFIILTIYACVAAFYRASARELKRLDAILRSSVYTQFSETLSGLATIRAYKEINRFQFENQSKVDIENRAYWLTVANQVWLGIRIDFLGSCMTFAVVMLSVGARFSLSPAQTGLLISYVMTVQQTFGMIVRQAAEVENSMNSVERINYYAKFVEQEAPHDLPTERPSPSWPAHGRIDVKNLVMKYRPDLPTVLKGISFDIKAREKVGIVGRTGAGKSSILTVLSRIVEPTSGTVIIDGVDVSKIGLDDLRNSLSIIPQDPLLFSGTIRTNLDPFNRHDEATLWDALKRAHLIADLTTTSLRTAEASTGTASPISKFNLDTIIEDEGSNFSVGQRSLVSLARALVKNSKILILDEATASVDYETDRRIQDTIASQFKDRTILCIAHRLRTIIGYDRICVLDAGQIAEFDTPSNLYGNPEGIFRGMCDRSSITLQDIAEARATTP